jgi:hypothetical protein
MRGVRHASGVTRRVLSQAPRAVAIAGLVLLFGGIALDDSGCGFGYEGWCPIQYQEPSTPAERAVARPVDAYVAAIAARDPRRACAQIAPRARRSLQAWQMNFDGYSPWLRCGERAFFRPEEAGLLVSHRASNVEFLTQDRQRGLRQGQAVASVEEGSRTAWAFFLERGSGGWRIVGMTRVDCEYVPG